SLHSSQSSNSYDLMRHVCAGVVTWPNPFDPTRRSCARNSHSGETHVAKFLCDHRVVSQLLDRVKGEGCPVSLSFVDGKFGGETQGTYESGSDSERCQACQ